jgi:hypothetical protein
MVAKVAFVVVVVVIDYSTRTTTKRIAAKLAKPA